MNDTVQSSSTCFQGTFSSIRKLYINFQVNQPILSTYFTILLYQHTLQYFFINILYYTSLSTCFTILLYQHTLQYFFINILYNNSLSTYFTILLYQHTLQYFFINIIDNTSLSTYFTILLYQHYFTNMHTNCQLKQCTEDITSQHTR